jgi:23S rRNA (guanosine2251-2'-O)-methyltransferase
MYLYGKNSVLERLKVNPSSIKKILLAENFSESSIEQLIKEKHIPTERLSLQNLRKIKKGDNLQGIVAKVKEYRYVSFDDLLTNSKSPTLLFLDRIYDPQNLGAVMRVAACFGHFAVIIPKYKACEVNETVLHVAQGAENYINVAMVANLVNAVIAAKKRGYWILGTVTDKTLKTLDKVSLPFPLGVVFGSEGEGIRYGIAKQIDISAHIAMEGGELSFNVASACAIFCYEIARQRTDYRIQTSEINPPAT